MSCLEFRGSTLTVVTVVLKTENIIHLESSLSRTLSKTPDFFSDEPTVIDASRLETAVPVDWLAIIHLLSHHGLKPFGIKSHCPQHCSGAIQAGLMVVDHSEVTRQFIKDQEFIEQEEKKQKQAESQESLLITYPVRSGQQIYHTGDIIVVSLSGAGSELISCGNIHLYAPLRGKALAGASGNMKASIFTTCFEAELVAIAGVYRAFEEGVPKSFLSQSVRVFLGENGAGEPEIKMELIK